MTHDNTSKAKKRTITSREFNHLEIKDFLEMIRQENIIGICKNHSTFTYEVFYKIQDWMEDKYKW